MRVRAAPLGGAFGGKVALIEPLVAGAALALRRPVRLTLTRSEDFQATNPAPAQLMEVRAGATRSGKLTALEARVVCDRGATQDWGLEDIASILVAGPYRWEAFAITGYGVQTNRVTFGAYRGPGAPGAAYAIESVSTSSLTSSTSTRSSSGSRTPSSRGTSASAGASSP